MLISNNDEHQSYRIKVTSHPEGGYIASSMGVEARGQSEATATSALKQELYKAQATGQMTSKRIA